MTIAEMKKACSENRYLLFRDTKGKLVGCNGRLPFLKPPQGKRRRSDEYRSKHIGFIPCGINEYISHKIGFIKSL